jgi:hypothetical protein
LAFLLLAISHLSIKNKNQFIKLTNENKFEPEISKTGKILPSATSITSTSCSQNDEIKKPLRINIIYLNKNFILTIIHSTNSLKKY